MEKHFKKSTRILSVIVLVCFLSMGALASAPGFSDGEVSSIVTDIGEITQAIGAAIYVDEEVVAAVAGIIADAGGDISIEELVAVIASDLDEVAEIAAEIVIAVIEETGSDNIIVVILDVVDAISSVSEASSVEVLATIMAAIPEEVLAGITLEFDTQQGINIEIPAIVFLLALVEHGVTDVTFAASFVSENSETFNSAVNAVLADLGDTVTVGQVVDLNLVTNAGDNITTFAGEITVSLPAAGNNAVAYYNEETGSVTLLPSRVRNGFVEFKTTHLSYFVLIQAPADSIPGFESAAPAPPVAEIALFTPALALSAIASPPAETELIPEVITLAEESSAAETPLIMSLSIENYEEAAAVDAPGAAVAPAAEAPKVSPLTGSNIAIFFLMIAAAAGITALVLKKRRLNH